MSASRRSDPPGSSMVSNEQITATTVRLIGVDGEHVGVVPIVEARRVAEVAGLDLVLVAGAAEPPVVKVVDAGRAAYEASVAERARRRAQRERSRTHEVKLRPQTAQHDFDVKVAQITKFVAAGDKVRVSVQLRGRQIGRPEDARTMLDRVLVALESVKVVHPVSVTGRVASMVVQRDE